MAARIYIAIFLIFHSQFCFAISLQTPTVTVPQIRDPLKKKKKNAIDKLIQYIKPAKWADFDINGDKKKGEGSEDGDGTNGKDKGEDEFGSDGNGNGNGNGGNGWGGGNAKNGKIGMDENAKGNPSANPGEKDPPVKPPGSPPENEPPAKQGEAYSKWFPTCIFIEPGINGNAQVKRVVDMAAFCKVNVEVYAFTVSPGSFNPNDPNDILNKQRSSCNILDTGTASKGSTLLITQRSKTVADEMCGVREGNPPKPTTNVAGCNEVAQGGGGNAQILKQQQGGVGDGLGAEASGGVAAGIVDNEGVGSGNVWSHETHGHGEMGLPNGKKAGNGIGFGDKLDDNDDGGEGGNGNYTQRGCAQFQTMALPNDGTHKYFPDRQKYYTENPNPQGQFILGTPVWGKPTPPTPPSGNPPPQPPAIARGDLSPGEKPSGNKPDQAGDLVLANSIGGGHKKPKLGGKTSTPNKIPDNKQTIAIGNSGSSITAPPVEETPQDSTLPKRDESIEDKKPSGEPENQKGSPTATLRMDESRQYNDAPAGALGPPNENLRAPLGGESNSGSGNSGGIRMDENASGREGAVSIGLRSADGSVGYSAIDGIDADSEYFTNNGFTKDFFKKKKPQERNPKRGDGLRKGGAALRAPASNDASKIYSTSSSSE